MSSLIFNEHFGINFTTKNCSNNTNKWFIKHGLKIAELRSVYDNSSHLAIQQTIDFIFSIYKIN